VTATAAKKLRADLKARTTILELINFNETRIFDSAAGQHNMISIVQRGTYDKPATTAVVSKAMSNAYDAASVDAILRGVSSSTVYAQLPQSELYDGDRIRLASPSTSDIEAVLDQVASSGVTLKDHFNVNQGVITGGDRISIANGKAIDGKPAGSGVFILSAAEVAALNLSDHESEIVRPHYKNSDVGRYVLRDPSHFLIYADKRARNLESRPVLAAHLEQFRILLDESSSNSPYLHRPRSVDFEGEKLVVPYRTTTNAFAYSNGAAYGTADTYFITPRTNAVAVKGLLGLLTSKLFFCWLYSRGKRKGETLELFQDPLQKLPLPKLTRDNSDRLRKIQSLVDEILAFKLGDPDSNVTSIETAVDGLVYELFDLTPAQVRLVDEWAPPRDNTQ
jgi:adenine-specific DNA-methyltransferase